MTNTVSFWTISLPPNARPRLLVTGRDPGWYPLVYLYGRRHHTTSTEDCSSLILHADSRLGIECQPPSPRIGALVGLSSSQTVGTSKPMYHYKPTMLKKAGKR